MIDLEKLAKLRALRPPKPPKPKKITPRRMRLLTTEEIMPISQRTIPSSGSPRGRCEDCTERKPLWFHKVPCGGLALCKECTAARKVANG
jgi:hypothetical protein